MKAWLMTNTNWNWRAIITFPILIKSVKMLSVHLGNKFFSTQLDEAQTFLLQHFKKIPNLLNSWMEMELYRQASTHIWGTHRQYGCHVSHSLTFTLLSRSPVISNPDRESIVEAQGTSECLLQLSLHLEWSHKSSPVQSGWTRAPKTFSPSRKGWGCWWWWWRFHLSLSLLFSPLSLSLRHMFSLPLLLLFLLLHSSIFSPPFCPCLPFWLAPFF